MSSFRNVYIIYIKCLHQGFHGSYSTCALPTPALTHIISLTVSVRSEESKDTKLKINLAHSKQGRTRRRCVREWQTQTIQEI